MDKIFLVITARKRKPPSLGDDVYATQDGNTRPSPPEIDGQDVGMAAFPPVASGKSWATGFSDQRPQSHSMKGGQGNKASPFAGAAAAPAVAATPAAAPIAPGAAFEFVGASSASVGEAQHPTGVRFGLGAGAGSAGSTTGSSFSSFSSSISSISNNSVGPVSAGDAPAAKPTPSMEAVREGNLCLDRQEQQAGDGSAQLPLKVSSVLSAQEKSATPGPADVGDSGNRGLELLHASELEAAKAAGLLDVVDELLGEAVSEGLEEASGEEGKAPAS